MVFAPLAFASLISMNSKRLKVSHSNANAAHSCMEVGNKSECYSSQGSDFLLLFERIQKTSKDKALDRFLLDKPHTT